MHPVLGQNGRVLAGPEVVVAPPAVILLSPRFDPTHLNGVNQFGHFLLLNERRDEAALICWSVGNRVEHQVFTEELHLRLRRVAGGQEQVFLDQHCHTGEEQSSHVTNPQYLYLRASLNRNEYPVIPPQVCPSIQQGQLNEGLPEGMDRKHLSVPGTR